MTWLTATHPLALAMEGIIIGDGTLGAALVGDKVYFRVASRTGVVRPRPYIVLAFPTEEPANTFGRYGHITTFQVHCCSALDGPQPLWIYNELKRLFQNPFALTDHVMVQVRLVLMGDMPEENNDGNRSVLQCTVRSLAAA